MDDRMVSAVRKVKLIDWSHSPNVRVRFQWFATITEANGVVTNLGGRPINVEVMDFN